jgi:uncharacterized protein with von Willebrand factor type A (vWA) domain
MPEETREMVRAERQALEADVRRMKVRHGMDKESLEILEMVKEGRVTPEQGTQLLEALKSQPSGVAMLSGGEKPKFVRVRVNVAGGEKEKVAVNVNLPVAMADLALKMLEKAEFTKDGEHIKFGDYMKDLGGMDVATILQMVKEGAEGKLVDVDIEGNDGETVKVEVIVD